MPKSLKQVLVQIAKLEKQAAALRAEEIEGVVSRIQQAISHYGLTPDDLFGAAPKRQSPKPRVLKARVEKKPKRGPSQPRYRSEDGRTWTGVGTRPKWFKAAIEAGKTAQDLEIKGD